MKNKIISLAALTVLVAAVVVYTQYNKAHRDIASEKADFSLTANELFDAFDENEKKANAKYLDKVIEVSGSIIETSKNQEGKAVLTLEAENALIGGVLCTMKNDVKLETGNQTLKCRCTGFLEDVILVDCSLVK